jgi:hypothetical protein
VLFGIRLLFWLFGEADVLALYGELVLCGGELAFFSGELALFGE